MSSSATRLRRVVLEDIGPFERLDLDFPKKHNWKVLLGDNGVGKSTILKAIAGLAPVAMQEITTLSLCMPGLHSDARRQTLRRGEPNDCQRAPAADCFHPGRVCYHRARDFRVRRYGPRNRQRRLDRRRHGAGVARPARPPWVPSAAMAATAAATRAAARSGLIRRNCAPCGPTASSFSARSPRCPNPCTAVVSNRDPDKSRKSPSLDSVRVTLYRITRHARRRRPECR